MPPDNPLLRFSPQSNTGVGLQQLLAPLGQGLNVGASAPVDPGQQVHNLIQAIALARGQDENPLGENPFGGLLPPRFKRSV